MSELSKAAENGATCYFAPVLETFSFVRLQRCHVLYQCHHYILSMAIILFYAFTLSSTFPPFPSRLLNSHQRYEAALTVHTATNVGCTTATHMATHTHTRKHITKYAFVTSTYFCIDSHAQTLCVTESVRADTY